MKFFIGFCLKKKDNTKFFLKNMKKEKKNGKSSLRELREILTLTFFDQVLGPTIFYSMNELDDIDHPDLGRILEFSTVEGTFIFAGRKYQTINHVFYLDSDLARGGKELVMISYSIRAAYFKNEIEDVFRYLDLKTPLLEEYTAELRNVEELPSILHKHKRSRAQNELFDSSSDKFKKEFLKTYNKYFERLSLVKIGAGPPTTPHQELKKLYIFGSKNTGKNTLLKTLEAIQFYKQNDNDLPSKFLEVSIDNLKVLKHDCVENHIKCESCNNYEYCIKKSQGFILLLNLKDRNSITDIKEKFLRLAKKNTEIKNGQQPFLIIGNIFDDKLEIDFKFVNDELNIKELQELGVKIKYYSIDILKDDNKLMEAFRWLIKQVL